MDYTWNVMPVYGVSTWVIVMLVVIVLLIAALVALSIYGKKLQDRQEDSETVAGGCTKCQASGH